MAGWGVKKVGDLDMYQAATMAWLPGVLQGFTTRQGGVSVAPYDSLNLGMNCGDDPAAVSENRRRLAEAIGVEQEMMVYAEQKHGSAVAVVDHPQAAPVPGVDALITGVPGLVLTMAFADCMPIYIVEPIKRVVAMVHAGWRGSAANILRRTTEVLVQRFDIAPRSCQVAIGPSIGPDHYEVGPEVADLFRESFASGASTPVLLTNEMQGRYSLSLRSVAFSQLLAVGYKADSITVCDDDTFSKPRDFFSHRREARSGSVTGRMAGFVGLNSRVD